MTAASSTSGSPVMLFLHIPKTAGTSVRIALESAFPGEQHLYLYPPADLRGAVHPDDFASLPERERARFRLVMGHFRFGLHESVPGPSRYVTLLRDPLDRVVSLYYHYKTLTPATQGSPGREEQERIRTGDLSLEEWVFEGNRPALDNGMVRQLVTPRGAPFGHCPDSMLAEAIEHITGHFDAVLIRGRMPQSMQMLSRLVGASLPPIGRANANPNRERLDAIDPKLRTRIRELNRLDDQLFRLMVERFPANYERVMQGKAQTPISATVVVPAKPEPARSERPASARPQARSGGDPAVRDRTLVFMHIPKTGGTGLRDVFKGAYGKDERAFVYDSADLRGAVSRDQLADMPEDQRQRLRLVMGHLHFGVHRAIGRPCRYVVVVRDPVERVVSLYYHYLHWRGWRRRSGPAKEEQQRMRQGSLSLEEWVFGQNRLALDNGITRNLAARQRVRWGECPVDLLDEALDHVDRHFAAMLVADRLDNCHELLERISGRSLGRIKHSNVNKKRPSLDELDPRLLDRIRELNSLDAQLYDIAQERLGELLHEAKA